MNAKRTDRLTCFFLLIFSSLFSADLSAQTPCSNQGPSVAEWFDLHQHQVTGSGWDGLVLHTPPYSGTQVKSYTYETLIKYAAMEWLCLQGWENVEFKNVGSVAYRKGKLSIERYNPVIRSMAVHNYREPGSVQQGAQKYRHGLSSGCWILYREGGISLHGIPTELFESWSFKNSRSVETVNRESTARQEAKQVCQGTEFLTSMIPYASEYRAEIRMTTSKYGNIDAFCVDASTNDFVDESCRSELIAAMESLLGHVAAKVDEAEAYARSHQGLAAPKGVQFTVACSAIGYRRSVVQKDTGNVNPSIIEITGTVKDKDGKPIKRAKVAIPEMNASQLTDDTGAYTLTALAQGEAGKKFSASAVFSLEREQVSADISIAAAGETLPVPGAVALTVRGVGQDGKALEDGSVRLKLVDPKGAELRLPFISFANKAGRLDAAGEFKTEIKAVKVNESLYKDLPNFGNYDLKYIPWSVTVKAEVQAKDSVADKPLGVATLILPVEIAPLIVKKTLVLQPVEGAKLIGGRQTGLRVWLDSEIPFDQAGTVPCKVEAYVDDSQTPATSQDFQLKWNFTDREMDTCNDSANLILPAEALAVGKHVLTVKIIPSGGAEVNTTTYKLPEAEWCRPKTVKKLLFVRTYADVTVAKVDQVAKDGVEFLRNLYPVTTVEFWKDDRVLYEKDGNEIYATVLSSLTDRLNEWNTNHPGQAAEMAVGVFTLGRFKSPGFDGLTDSKGQQHFLYKKAILTCNSESLAHELGHYYGLKDTYTGEDSGRCLLNGTSTFDLRGTFWLMGGKEPTPGSKRVACITFMGNAGNMSSWVDAQDYNRLYDLLP